MNRKRIIRLIFLFCSIYFLQTPHEAYAISWYHNYDKAVRKAKVQDKPIMIDFYTDWCGWCKKLDKDTFANKKVSSLSEYFICIKVNADKDKKTKNKYKVNSYPTILFLDSKENPVWHIPGYVGPGDFAKAMDIVLKKTNGYKKKKVKPSSGFELGGISYSPTNPIAIVNGAMVTVGENVEGAKVVEINKSNVKLNHNGKEIILHSK